MKTAPSGDARMPQTTPAVWITLDVMYEAANDRQIVRAPNSDTATANRLDTTQASIRLRLNYNKTKQEAQLPLREQGVSFVFSHHRNTTYRNLALLSLVIRYMWDFSKPTWAGNGVYKYGTQEYPLSFRALDRGNPVRISKKNFYRSW